jgi:hypothetical protein
MGADGEWLMVNGQWRKSHEQKLLVSAGRSDPPMGGTEGETVIETN